MDIFAIQVLDAVLIFSILIVLIILWVGMFFMRRQQKISSIKRIHMFIGTNRPEVERDRMTQELHDTIGPGVVRLRFLVSQITLRHRKYRAEGQKVDQELQEIIKLVRNMNVE